MLGGFDQLADRLYPLRVWLTLMEGPLAFLLLLNAGGMIGSIALGLLSEKWGRRRGSATVGMDAGILATP